MNTLGGVFDSRRNGLNAVRLGLAAAVIVYHSNPITGHVITFAPLRRLAENGPVDGFFAISGFLIVSSWVRRPHAWAFVRARALRILPGVWTCLVVTAAVIAPLAMLGTGHDLPAGYPRAAARFVYDGLDLRMHSYGIGATPTDVPFPGVWNGSLWTLFWEVLCYAAVLAAGLLGLLRRRWAIPLAFVAALAGQVLVDAGPLAHNFWAKNLARFGLMFAAGALVWLWRDRIPVGRWWTLGAIALATGSLALPDYRLLGALPLAYLVLVLGAAAKAPHWRLRNDLSYGVYIYGFPVQQTLALAGVWRAGVPLFALASLACTLPVAAASWFAVERPALRLKGPRVPAPVPEVAVATA